MPKRKPQTPLPPVGEDDEKAHAQISVRFTEHTVIEIENENRLQASEKVWGTVAHAIKAVAEQRGWEHKGHSKLRDVARQLGTEAAEAQAKTKRKRKGLTTAFVRPFKNAESMHSNFYENGHDWPDILEARDDAQVFLAQLNAFRDQPPGRFKIREPGDQRRLARLLGVDLREVSQEDLDRMLPIDSESEVGFSPNFGFRLPDLAKEDNGDAPTEAGPHPGNPKPDGGQAKPSRKSGPGTTKVALKMDKQIGPDKADSNLSRKNRRRSRQPKQKGGQSPKVNIQLG